MNTIAEPRRTVRYFAILCGLAIGIASFTSLLSAENPPSANVILIEVDGLDLKNPDKNRTPRLAKFREDCVRLTNFHVDPLRTPRHAALLTGRYALRTGVWSEGGANSLLPEREVTLAEMLVKTRYRAALFGTWGLGDMAPFQPRNQGI